YLYISEDHHLLVLIVAVLQRLELFHLNKAMSWTKFVLWLQVVSTGFLCLCSGLVILTNQSPINDQRYSKSLNAYWHPPFVMAMLWQRLIRSRRIYRLWHWYPAVLPMI